MLTVLHQDQALVAISKPPGRVVIPSRRLRGGGEDGDSFGEGDGNGDGDASDIPLKDELSEYLQARVYVVHRLDRGTSGVLVFALTPEAHRSLSLAFEGHRVQKRYQALCQGLWAGEGEADLPLVPRRGGLMRVARPGDRGAKPSLTRWRSLERFSGFTWMEFLPHTGRLHQIRVHAAAMGFPLAVDPAYGGRAQLTRDQLEPGGDPEEVVLDRLSLHASTLRLPHPQTGDPLELSAPLPPDLAHTLDLLRRARDGRS